MDKTAQSLRLRLVMLANAALLAACASDAPVAPNQQLPTSAQFTALRASEKEEALVRLRRATARYHNLNIAIDEGFVLLHECENRPGEGPVGTVYVHMGRLTDGRIDPNKPEALIYQPARRGAKPKLVGVEFAVPYALWPGDEPPKFLGVPFHPEDEFGVFGLHVWIWSANPNGLFAESNPKISCGVE